MIWSIDLLFTELQKLFCQYMSLVKPHPEYCVQAWCPYLEKYIELLEKVQHRATKMMDLRDKTYEDRLRAFYI